MLLALAAATCTLLAACGGGEDDAAAASGFAATCSAPATPASTMQLPTAAQVAAYAGTYNGDEGSYDQSGNFTKSASATLTIASDGRITYKGTAYEPSSICIDKAAGTYGTILYFEVGKTGQFDVADKIDATLGQAWGVSPVDGTTIFTNGRK